MSTILETNIYGLWFAKQPAKGQPATTATQRPIMVAGNFAGGRDEGSEPYSDLGMYGASTDWVNTVTGGGEPGIEATPTMLAYLLWLFHGAETVTADPAAPAVATRQRHRFVPSPGIGHPFTSWLRVGQSTIRREKFNDCYITRVQLEGSTANKATRITPRIISLDPSEVFATDPAVAMPTEKVILYTDAAGAYKLDGEVYRGQTQYTFVADAAWTPVYGDDGVPYAFQQGTPSVTIGATIHLDAQAQARINKQVYGTAAPAAGTRPLRGVSPIGSYSVVSRQKDAAGVATGIGFDLTIPGVKWDLPEAPSPNPSGGGTELAMAGRMRPVAGQQPYTLDVYTPADVLAFTA